MHICLGTQEARSISIPLILELYGIVSHLTCMLGTKLWSWGKVDQALNHEAIFHNPSSFAVGGIKPRSPCLWGNYLTCWTVSPALGVTFCKAVTVRNTSSLIIVIAPVISGAAIQDEYLDVLCAYFGCGLWSLQVNLKFICSNVLFTLFMSKVDVQTGQTVRQQRKVHVILFKHTAQTEVV